METQTRLSRHNKFISAENIVGMFAVSSDDSFYMLCLVPEMRMRSYSSYSENKIKKIKEIKKKNKNQKTKIKIKNKDKNKNKKINKKHKK